jgi:hypothetical protein
MTEIAGTQRRRRASTRSVTLRLVAASLIASAAIAGGLAIQMAGGQDPALGAGTSTARVGSGSSGQSASPPAAVTTRSS